MIFYHSLYHRPVTDGLFLPNNGQTFSPTGTNIIRIDVNADSMLDPCHSVLQATITADSSTAGDVLCMDVGCPWIKRLRIESGGVTLEDINEYGRLYALLEYAQFAPDNFTQENSILLNQNQSIGYSEDTTNMLNNPQYICSGDTGGGRLISGDADYASTTVSIPLVSAILNQSKYVPLILQNAGLTIELTLSSASEIGCQVVTGGTTGTITPSYNVSKVAYVAHLIDMDRSFYDALRAEMALSGSIAISGHTWKHYGSNVPAGSTSANINIPARAKSIKSIFSTFRDALYSQNSATKQCSIFRRCFTEAKYKFLAISCR